MRKLIFLSLALIVLFDAQGFCSQSGSKAKNQMSDQNSMINPYAPNNSSDTVAGGVPVPPEIENPELLGINKVPAHATLMVYSNQADALKANRHASSFCQSLKWYVEV